MQAVNFQTLIKIPKQDQCLVALVDFLNRSISLNILRTGYRNVQKNNKIRKDGIKIYGDLQFANSADENSVNIICQAVNDPLSSRGFTATSTSAAEDFITAVWHVLKQTGIESECQIFTHKELRVYPDKTSEYLPCYRFTLNVKNDDITKFIGVEQSFTR